MRLSKCFTVGAFILAGLLAHSATAQATPVSTAAELNGLRDNVSRNGLLHKVSGCHQTRQYHMVFKWGYPAWHRHGARCNPIAANPPGTAKYCHRGWQWHAHPAQGGSGSHRHVGPNCVVRWR